jgi:hypothetical protein
MRAPRSRRIALHQGGRCFPQATPGFDDARRLRTRTSSPARLKGGAGPWRCVRAYRSARGEGTSRGVAAPRRGESGKAQRFPALGANVRIAAPLAASHSRIVPSQLAETIERPSGEKATASTRAAKSSAAAIDAARGPPPAEAPPAADDSEQRAAPASGAGSHTKPMRGSFAPGFVTRGGRPDTIPP